MGRFIIISLCFLLLTKNAKSWSKPYEIKDSYFPEIFLQEGVSSPEYRKIWYCVRESGEAALILLEHTLHRSQDSFIINVLNLLIAYSYLPKKPSLNLEIIDQLMALSY